MITSDYVVAGAIGIAGGASLRPISETAYRVGLRMVGPVRSEELAAPKGAVTLRTGVRMFVGGMLVSIATLVVMVGTGWLAGNSQAQRLVWSAAFFGTAIAARLTSRCSRRGPAARAADRQR